MKTVFELVGSFIISLILISIPILCTLSFVYDWYPGFKFILIVTCGIEYLGLINLLLEKADKQD